MQQQKRKILVGVGGAVLGLAIAAGAVLAAGPHGSWSGASATSAPSGIANGAGYDAGTGTGGYGTGYGASGTAGQARTQAFDAALAQPVGTLTAAQAAGLAGMAEEEQLALNLYTAFGAQDSTPVWRNIAAAEATHLAAVRSLLARYQISDPTAGRSAGDFASLEMTNLYRSLLARGTGSAAEALAAGATVENDDIARLDAAASGITAPDVAAVYASLRAASQQHLAAFTRLLGR